MKELRFKTSKCEFLLNEEGKGISLKEITEEEASEIVDERKLDLWQITQEFNKYYDYMSRNERGISCLESAKESLHSLLKSKGIHLFENPAPLPNYDLCPFTEFEEFNSQLSYFQEQAEKTFYNPYIFKL